MGTDKLKNTRAFHLHKAKQNSKTKLLAIK